MSYQRGSLKKVKRREGEIWVLRYRVTNSDGRRVENIMPIGLVQRFPKGKDAWREADRLGLSVRINDAPAVAPSVSFHFLAEHYLKADFGADAVRPKSENTTSITESTVRNYLIDRWGTEIADDIKPLDIHDGSNHRLSNQNVRGRRSQRIEAFGPDLQGRYCA